MTITRTEMVNNLIINMERERVRMGLTQAQMAKKLELSTSGYKKMVSGETAKIDIYIAHLMYMMTGRVLAELCGTDEISEDLKICSKLRHLTPSQLKFIDGIIDFESDFSNKNPESEDYISVLVPTGNMEDGMILDSFNVKKINIGDSRKKYGDLIHCGILVTSENLRPVYHAGDVLLICRRTPRDGDTAIFVNKNDGRAYIRKVCTDNPRRLMPVNDQGMTFYIDNVSPADASSWISFGYVISKLH